MKRTFLIASAAYVEPELEVEFGRLPPAFLPLANRRLFEHQCKLLRGSASRVILSLPEDFEPEPADLATLEDLGCEIVKVPPGLSLGQSLVYVINVTASSGGAMSVLYGDTLMRGIDLHRTDVVAIGDAPVGYQWGHVEEREGRLVSARNAAPPPTGTQPSVLSGYFAFADVLLLVQSVTRRGGDFLAALAEYSERRPLGTERAEEWLDLGHVGTYHQSRRRMTTEREFNRLEPTRRRVVKSGRDPQKIEAEARWFEQLPAAMRVHAPALLGFTQSAEATSYAIEYLYLPTLADLFVFGRLPAAAWGQIFEACDEFLTACADRPAPAATAATVAGLYAEKTLKRLETYARSAGLDLAAPCRLGGSWLPSLERMVSIAAERIPAAEPRHLTLVHGDFCFSNILYDIRANLVRVIDPRGLGSDGTFAVHGDIRYDFGKLYHSIVGRYDHILAGMRRLRRFGELDFELDLPDNPMLRAIEAEFTAHHFAGMTMAEAHAPASAVLLFLSMLPLHADDPDRQTALLANAMRLFLRLDSGPQARKAAA